MEILPSNETLTTELLLGSLLLFTGRQSDEIMLILYDGCCSEPPRFLSGPRLSFFQWPELLATDGTSRIVFVQSHAHSPETAHTLLLVHVLGWCKRNFSFALLNFSIWYLNTFLNKCGYAIYNFNAYFLLYVFLLMNYYLLFILYVILDYGNDARQKANFDIKWYEKQFSCSSSKWVLK